MYNPITVYAVAVQFSSDSHHTRLEEDDTLEGHSATDEAWHWSKPGSSILDKNSHKFQVE